MIYRPNDFNLSSARQAIHLIMFKLVSSIFLPIVYMFCCFFTFSKSRENLVSMMNRFRYSVNTILFNFITCIDVRENIIYFSEQNYFTWLHMLFFIILTDLMLYFFISIVMKIRLHIFWFWKTIWQGRFFLPVISNFLGKMQWIVILLN